MNVGWESYLWQAIFCEIISAQESVIVNEELSNGSDTIHCPHLMLVMRSNAIQECPALLILVSIRCNTL